MRYSDIEAFLAVVKCKTLTKAAESIHISQPALSKRILQLETELGEQLISRRKGQRSIDLTEKGIAFVPLANRFMAVWNDIKNLDSQDSYPSFRIASSDGPHLYILQKVYNSLMSIYPNLTLKLRTFSYKECYQRIANGTLDLALVGANFYFDKITSVPVYSEKMHFICRKDSDYPSFVEPGMLDAANAIYSSYSTEYNMWFSHWFCGKCDPYIESDLILQVKEFLLNSKKNMWTFVPTSALDVFLKEPNLSMKEFSHEPPERIIYLINKVEEPSEYISAFKSILKAVIQDIEGIKLLL